MIKNWKKTRVTVLGLGRFGGGVGAVRWLARQGARVLVTDMAQPEKLEWALGQIAEYDVELRLGEHRESDFRDADLVVTTPIVKDSNRYLQVAIEAGAPITTEINLFAERCPAPCVGITGSVGKSTTTAMIGRILERTMAGRRIWVGGNLGVSLLNRLEEIREEDLAVVELSNFQLSRAPLVEWSPQVAVITNILNNHLDWHDGSMDGYAAAKFNIIKFQNRAHGALVIGDHDNLRQYVTDARGDMRGTWTYGLEDDAPCAWRDDSKRRWEDLNLLIPGRHNRENASAALTVAHVLGVESRAAVTALATFEGLEHRLQRVAQRDGVTYYDDSKSTSPEASIAALEVIEEPSFIILGGFDKTSDMRPLSELAARRTKFAACIGTTGPDFVEHIRAAGGQAEFFSTLAGAVGACQAQARAGDVVLLSPACASWDMFADYRVRGHEFARLARGE